ncbi:MAG: hypothetical protein F6K25_12485 [Okeania sp. SIO2G4]|uniref:hypothetical protein n=1 Tax=unclassified Okeania TaxID=2634635 RepID=UPI0013BBC2AB|nr:MULTISPECIES: hypothetical protein [unclassified Okeania]NEP42836.1 hypothetical protein [Okeania sp. SIO2H7]NEP73837.1 hypothetical protein [Okeania sp. SIO2G5]NEP94985.1 hypothetical protein [Okeania sp. SIO2F5]NEQ91477.1 hypothetical protein [Okeania sp. SIO2G4]
MNTQIRGYLENITLGIIAGILTNFITASIVNYFQTGAVAIKQYKTISTVIVVLVTPIFFNYFLQKLNISFSKIALVSWISITMLLEGILFSVIPTKEININQQDVGLYPKYSKYFEGVDLKRTPYNKVWTLDDAKIGITKDKLHILLKVEWEKREKMKGLKRNYQGDIYYQMDISDSLLTGQTEMKTKISSYSFRPGAGILSYIIGFIDTGYLIKTTNDFTSDIEEIVRENRIVEEIKERR